MELLPSNPDQNSIENLSSFVKMKLYKGGEQYNRKPDLQKVSKTTIAESKPT